MYNLLLDSMYQCSLICCGKQVLWACFDRVELGPSSFKQVLLLGYSNGFQVLDVEDASSVKELASRRDDPVTFLQMQPLPAKCEGQEGFRSSHPLLMVVACDESKSSGMTQTGREGLVNGHTEPQTGNSPLSPTAVRFYSLRSCNYVHVLRFRSTVYMVRCSPQIVAVGLASQVSINLSQVFINIICIWECIALLFFLFSFQPNCRG